MELKELIDSDLQMILENMEYYEKYYNIINQFSMRKADKVLFYDKVKNRNFRSALTNILTMDLIEDLDFASLDKQNLIYCLIGKTGRGKTTLAFIIYKHMLKFNNKAKIFLVYSLAKALQILKEEKDIRHYVIVLDELLRLTGTFSITIVKNLLNIIDMCREFEVCFIFNIKIFKDLGNVDVYLQLFGINKEKKETRCLWLNEIGKPIGIAILEKNFQDEEFPEYIEAQKRKKQKWQFLLEKEGQDKVYNIDEIINELCIQFKKENDLEFYSNMTNVKDYLISNSNYPEKILEDIARKVKAKISMELKRSKKEEIQYLSNPLQVSIKNFELIQIEDLYDKYLEKLILILNITEKQKQLLEYHLIEKLGSKQLIAKLKTKEFNQSYQISNFKKNIAKEIGLKIELIYVDILTDKKEKFRYYGGRINPIDFIIDSKKWILSLKTVYKEKDALNHIYTLNLQEYEKAKELSYELIYGVIILENKEIWYYKYNREEKVNE